MKKTLSEPEAESSKTKTHSLKSSNCPKESAVLKPLVHGCLTGQVHALLIYSHKFLNAHLAESMFEHRPLIQQMIPGFKSSILKELRLNMVKGAIHSTASLGLFELLTKRIQANNNGTPLSLYQEVCCGLTCGATAAFVWQPIVSVVTAASCVSYRQLFMDINRKVRAKEVVAMLKSTGTPYIGPQTAKLMGMLASYNTSLNYLKESRGLSKTSAEMSASIISGFTATTAYFSYLHLLGIKHDVERRYCEGTKDAYKDIPYLLTHILTPYRGFKFYSTIFTRFLQTPPFYMVQWSTFEALRLCMYDRSM